MYVKFPVMANLNFQHHYSLSSVSHDPSEIILKWWFGETFHILCWKLLCCL